MIPSDYVKCADFPCKDVKTENYQVPGPDIDPQQVSIVVISEAAPPNPVDYFYAGPQALFLKTTLLAFNDAGAPVASLQDLLDLGVYLTQAVKCGKTGYALESGTVERCSYLLERELSLFPAVKAYLLMGDVAIKAINAIARRAGAGRVIPAGSTYKIRGNEYFFQGRRAFPSYLQAGPSFFIEKSKRKVIAEDIAAALRVAQA